MTDSHTKKNLAILFTGATVVPVVLGSAIEQGVIATKRRPFGFKAVRGHKFFNRFERSMAIPVGRV
jgi:hypothetical protein